MSSTSIRIRKICEHCGKEFIAQKCSTRYCCKQCNSAAYKHRKRMRFVQEIESKQTLGNLPQTIGEDIHEREYLSIKQAMRLLGVSRRTIYNLIEQGALKASQPFKRKTIIRRLDVKAMVDANPYQKRHKEKVSQPIVEFYTAKEIAERYNISPTYLYKLAQKITLPHVFKRGVTYWSKKHIDAYFAKQAPDASITEWYTAQEIMDKYGMTLTAVYCMASDNNIPKRKEKRNVYYSKKHVDEVKAAQSSKQKAEPEYYSVKEAMEKYNFTRDQVYHYCIYYNIPREKRGKYTFIDKKRFDEVVSAPIIP